MKNEGEESGYQRRWSDHEENKRTRENTKKKNKKITSE